MSHALRRPAAAVLAAVVLLVTAGCSDDDRAPTAGPGDTTSTPTGAPTPTPATPEEFCEVFRAFAAASNLYVGAADETTADALVDVATRLASLDPAGLSPGGQVALDQLVNGSLDPLGVTVEPFNDALPDQAALDGYLTENCPA